MEEIAKILEVDVLELLSLGEKAMMVFIGDNSPENFFQHINCFKGNEKSSLELEKANLIIEQQSKEIAYLKQQNSDLRKIIELLEKNNS